MKRNKDIYYEDCLIGCRGWFVKGERKGERDVTSSKWIILI